MLKVQVLFRNPVVDSWHDFVCMSERSYLKVECQHIVGITSGIFFVVELQANCFTFKQLQRLHFYSGFINE